MPRIIGFFCARLNYMISLGVLLHMKLYLTDRKQKCQLDETILSEVQITCGIIQGSILGPLFFLLYVNDLPDCLRQATVHGCLPMIQILRFLVMR